MPAIQNYIFNRKLLQKTLERVELNTIPDYQHKLTILGNWKHAVESSILKNAGEVAIHGDFLIDVFGHVLGYKRQIEHPTEWNLTHEQKTKTDATKADGALGFFTPNAQDIRAVIELKDIRTDLDAKQHRKHDKRTPVEQAFSYVHKSGKLCRWIIVSNYNEIRLYHADSSGEYERFSVLEIAEISEFKRFYTLLSAENLLAKDGQSVLDRLYSSNEAEQENISKTFYSEYKQARIHLFEHIRKQNPEQNELLLLEKAQKLLDRFIFVCFCEDTDLLPQNIFRQVVQHAKQSFSFSEGKIWPELQGLFKAIDEGYPARGINGFNGGLFSQDYELDALHIGDSVFEELARITDYDFDSDLSVNILGHIFEQSISDLEELRASIQGEKLDYKQGKRKKEGIFYTPEYITRYIVEHAVGDWLEDRKQDLGVNQLPELTEQDYGSIKNTKTGFKWNKKIEKHVNFWEAYKTRLMNITILDPACGSGAFLNQAFDFLYLEGQKVNKTLASFRQGQTEIFDLNKHILSNNLYGVDLNNESAEITKLSLWLKTANKSSALTALDDNIKCGNSLVENPLIAGEKAFKWEREFPQIFNHGGFDIVLGNPPYLGGQHLKRDKQQYDYILGHYSVAEFQFDLYILFYELAINICKSNGYISFITPNTWFTNISCTKLRSFILESTSIRGIVDYSSTNVFKDAVVLTAVVNLKKENNPDNIIAIYCPPNLSASISEIKQNSWEKDVNRVFNITLSEDDLLLKQKIEGHAKPLSELAEVKFGVKIYEVGKGNPPQTREQTKAKIYESNIKIDDTYMPYLEGKDINSFLINWDSKWLKYGGNLAAPRKKDLFEGERILVRRIMGETLIAAFTNETIITNALLQIVKPIQPEYAKSILLILSSKLIAYYFRKSSNRQDKVFPEIKIHELSSLPIRLPNDVSSFNAVADKMLGLNQTLHERKSKFINRLTSNFEIKKVSKKLEAFYDYDFQSLIAELKKQRVKMSLLQQDEWEEYFAGYKTEVTDLQLQINDMNEKINLMVYELYELTDSEVQVIKAVF